MADHPRLLQVINTTTRVSPRNPRATNPEAVFETTRKPALGPSFAFMADTTLWLSQRADEQGGGGENGTTHTAEVIRSRVVVSPGLLAWEDGAELGVVHFQRSKTWALFKIQRGVLTSA